MSESYRIVRFFADGRNTRTMKRGLTIEQAQEHCAREDTHKKDKFGNVIWFDGYTREH